MTTPCDTPNGLINSQIISAKIQRYLPHHNVMLGENARASPESTSFWKYRKLLVRSSFFNQNRFLITLAVPSLFRIQIKTHFSKLRKLGSLKYHNQNNLEKSKLLCAKNLCRAFLNSYLTRKLITRLKILNQNVLLKFLSLT